MASWYSVGTVYCVNGTTAVSGTGTDFVSGARVGDGIKMPDGNIYEIAAIGNATSLTLGENYAGSTINSPGSAYSIIQTQNLTSTLAGQVSTLINDYQTGLDSISGGIFQAANGAVTAPSLTFASDLNTGIYSIAADQLGVAASGVQGVKVTSTAVTLNNAGSAKLATTSTGIDVTGTVVADGLTVDAAGSLSFSAAVGVVSSVAGLVFDVDSNNNTTTDTLKITRDNQAAEMLRVTEGGDISFYEDTGTTAKFFWDASAESLGIGTSSPASLIHGEVADATVYTSTTLPPLTARLVNANSTVGASAMLGYTVAGASGTGIIYAGAIGGGSSSSASYIIGARTGSSTYAERLRIDSSGNVGIGTTSPTAKLEIRNDVTASTDLDPTAIKLFNNLDGGSAIEFSNSVAGKSKISFGVEATGSGTDDTYIGFSTSLNAGALTERLRIDSSGNVGIGTSSPLQKIHLSDSADVGIQLTKSGSVAARVQAVSGALKFGIDGANGDTERARIDSSGNLLVGTTTAGVATLDGSGFNVYSSGQTHISQASNTALLVNRKTDNGAVVEFKRGGATAGSISVANTDIVTFGSNDTNLYFDSTNNRIIPSGNGGNALSAVDNSIDLGVGAYRFKDLYLSGGVYLGGTGAANHLDDYETGTWTPTYLATTTNPTVTYDPVVNGRYTKIGNMVIATAILKTDSVSGGSGNLLIGGLPFTVVSTTSFNAGSVVVAEIGGFNTNFPSHGRPNQNSTVVSLFYRATSNSTETALPITSLNTGINSNILTVTVIYEAA